MTSTSKSIYSVHSSVVSSSNESLSDDSTKCHLCPEMRDETIAPHGGHGIRIEVMFGAVPVSRC